MRSRLRIGFIGVGTIAQEHLKIVHQSEIAKIVAVCDISEEAAMRTAQKYDAVAYTNHVKMLDCESLDAVFVCVPPFAHGSIERDVAERGIHLFVEKPLGLDLETVRTNLGIIKKSGVITAVGYCMRYWDIVREAKSYLEDREIALFDGYFCTSFVSVPWWRVMQKSGGQLVEQGTHIVDLLRYLAGEVVQVQAFMKLVASQDVEGLDIYDVSSINMTLQNGAVGHIKTTFLQPDTRSGIELMGRGFRLTVGGGTLTIVDKERTVITKSSVDFYQEQDRAFLTAVKTGHTSTILCPYDEALKTLEVTLAANKSAVTGEIITMNEEVG